MATTTIRSTYALDVETVRTLERIAQRWKVSKSEALRRAIRAAAGEGDAGDALAALDRLQGALELTPARARSWARRARQERPASSARGETRGPCSISTRASRYARPPQARRRAAASAPC